MGKMDKKEFIFLNRISSVDSIDALFLTFEAIFKEVIIVDFSLTGAVVKHKKSYREISSKKIEINFTQLENIFLKENVIFVKDYMKFLENYDYLKEENFNYVIFPVIVNKSLKHLIIVKSAYSKECFLLAGNIIFNLLQKISLQTVVERSRSYFETIFNNINSKIVIVDKNYNILFSNIPKQGIFKCYEAMFNFPNPCMFCFRENRTIKININNSHFEIQHILLDNSMVCIIKDITNFIKLKDELIKSQQLSLLGKFSSEITHEIKNPLNSIKLKLEILKRKWKDAEEIREIEREINRLSQITNEFLQLGKEISLEKKEFELREFFEKLKNYYRETFDKRNIEFKIECSEKINLNADFDKIFQVFVNLINNCIDANCSEIIIQCKNLGREIEITVKDNGIGIKRPEKIFTPFYSEKEFGSGLGLIIAKRIVEAHKGKIEYCGRENNYTEFKITFPG